MTTQAGKKDIVSERGAALVLALIVMTALSLLAISSLELMTTGLQITGNHKRDLQAIYIADAGIEDLIDRLRDNPICYLTLCPDENNKMTAEFPSGSGNTYEVYVDTSHLDYVEGSIIPIISTGTVNGFPRTIEAEVQIVETPELGSPYSVVMLYWKEI